MFPLLHVVFDNLVQGKHEEYCALCLEKFAEDEDRFQVSDEVTIESGQEVVVESLDSIMGALLGYDKIEIFHFLNAVCKQCMDQAISSYKFVIKSKRQMATLEHVVDTLNNCLEETPDDEESEEPYQSLFIAAKKDFQFQQIYDTHKQSDPKQSALKRFQFIYERISAPTKTQDGRRKRIYRDVSTIFIKTHELVYDPSKPKEFKCKVCLKLYPNAGCLRQHFFSKHFKKEFQCTDCPKSFGTEGLLYSHMSQSHLTVNCEECGKTLRNRISTLKRHADSHARGLKVCNRCGRTYKKVVDFERHIAQKSCLHPSKAPGNYECDVCSYSCHFKHLMAQHIKYEHSGAKPHICQWCNRKCYSQSALKTHILKHTKEKNFVCTECGGRFVTRQSLTNHIRLHTGERPYQCPNCDQRFLSASRRKEHIERKHIDEMYACNMCDAKYNAKRSLVKHKKKHLAECIIKAEDYTYSVDCKSTIKTEFECV